MVVCSAASGGIGTAGCIGLTAAALGVSGTQSYKRNDCKSLRCGRFLRDMAIEGVMMGAGAGVGRGAGKIYKLLGGTEKQVKGASAMWSSVFGGIAAPGVSAVQEHI